MRIFLLFLIFLSNPVLAQKIGRKVYFLNSTIFKPTDELVVIVNGPQSKFAEELGSRIYRDSNVIKKICSTFYEQIENDSTYVDVQYYCGKDLFFYIKRDNMIYGIQNLNSDCEFDEIGGKENLNLLELGEKLIIDTLNKGFSKRKKDEVLENVIQIKHIRGSRKYDMTHYDSWLNISNGNKYPRWYYDGSVTLNIDFHNKPYHRDTVLTFLKGLGFTSTSVNLINWDTGDDYTNGNITIYIKKELFPFFKDYTVHEFTKKDYKNFIVLPDKKYILYKIP
jgi:hypothetical protein